MAKFEKVLHVDDDDDVRAIVAVALSLNDRLTVLQCASGPEAVETCKNFQPDLLLLDLMMPGMSGEEAWEEIRCLPGLLNVPAIFLTAKAQSETTQRLMAKGALGVIGKPFDPMQLSTQLDDFWSSDFG